MAFKDKLKEIRKNKEAVRTIKRIQEDRDTQQEVKTVIQEYGVDEDTATRYVQNKHRKEKVKVAVAKRNAIIRNIGSAIGKGAAKAAEASREMEKRKQTRDKQKKKDAEEATWTPQS